jgi:hypothetical protein
MKVLYLINLFIACCSSFIIQPSYSLVKYNHYSCISSNLKINKIELRKSLINVKNKNNNENDNKNENESLIMITKIITNFINYMIIYIYINILVSVINEMIMK